MHSGINFSVDHVYNKDLTTEINAKHCKISHYHYYGRNKKNIGLLFLAMPGGLLDPSSLTRDQPIPLV